MVNNLLRISVVLIAFLVDVVFTFVFMSYYRKKNPDDENWADMELNPVMRFCWSKFGFNKGTLICSAIIYPVIFLIAFVVSFDDIFFGMIIGIYYIVFVIHTVNLRQLFKHGKKKKRKK